MAQFEYTREIGLWTKICPRCKTMFKGTEHQTESEKIFLDLFGSGQRFGDGLQAFCKKCTRERRRERNGVVGVYDEQQMYKDQGGKCFLCTVDLHLPYRYSADPQGARIDHDHKTGRIRGLLCHRCNSMIGMFEATLEVFPEFDLHIIEKYIARGQ